MKIQPLHELRPVKGWEEYFRHGEGFLNTAAQAHSKGVLAFTPEILYNLIAMAIEKFVMAALMRHGELPYNHTMADLVAAMEQVFPGKMGDIGEGLLKMDQYQDICSLDGFKISPPMMEEIPAMLKLAERLRQLVQEQLLTI
ncbi:hypothetical protein [Candidatus Electronema sp. JC]|uniref:hypothetical protein n=1 Tax=Candidatus Electronema sp. JC TaxID=3401570 RepID=UPI003AA8C1A6